MILAKRAIISLNTINRMISVMERRVLCKVGTGFLNIIWTNFMCLWVSNVVISWDYIASMDRIILNNEMEGKWKEAAIPSFKALFRNMSGGTKELFQNPKSG
jgi:hypothetical protein